MKRLRAARIRLRSRLCEEDGVTLIELMTVIGMLGITFTAGFFFYLTATNRTEDSQARADTLSEERVLIENVARDSREGARLVIRNSSNVAATSGKILDIYGVAQSGGQRLVTRYDCSSSAGTCTRATYSWDPGTGGATVPVVPSIGSAIGTPAVQITGLDTSVNTFTGSADPSSAPLTTFTIHLQKLPEGRDQPISLERVLSSRNVCIYAPPSGIPDPAVCGVS